MRSRSNTSVMSSSSAELSTTMIGVGGGSSDIASAATDSGMPRSRRHTPIGQRLFSDSTLLTFATRYDRTARYRWTATPAFDPAVDRAFGADRRHLRNVQALTPSHAIPDEFAAVARR